MYTLIVIASIRYVKVCEHSACNVLNRNIECDNIYVPLLLSFNRLEVIHKAHYITYEKYIYQTNNWFPLVLFRFINNYWPTWQTIYV